MSNAETLWRPSFGNRPAASGQYRIQSRRIRRSSDPVTLKTLKPANPQLWPDFPVPMKQGAAARVGSKVFAGLGSAGSAWFVLDTLGGKRGWERLAPYPGLQRENPTAVSLGHHIYFFGGQITLSQTPQALQVDESVYRYDTFSDTWECLPTRAPFGLLASSAATLDNRTIVFVGGVNKSVFDSFALERAGCGGNAEKAAQLTESYLNKRPEDYFFMKTVLQFDPGHLCWSALAQVPGEVTIGAAVAVRNGMLTMASGELKPGLRSRHMREFWLDGQGQAHWSQEPIGGIPWEQQDGFAGGYAGYSGNTLLLAGGATFPGSVRQYQSGQRWAHRGLRKVWSDRVYAYTHGQWRVAGRLPAPMGYSPYIQLDDGVLVIGGELQDEQPSARCFQLRMHEQELVIEY